MSSITKNSDARLQISPSAFGAPKTVTDKQPWSTTYKTGRSRKELVCVKCPHVGCTWKGRQQYHKFHLRNLTFIHESKHNPSKDWTYLNSPTLKSVCCDTGQTQNGGLTAHWEMQPRLAPCSCSTQAPCRQPVTLCKLTATHTSRHEQHH